MQAKIDTKLLASIAPQAKRFDVCDTTLPGLVLRVESSGVMTFYARYRVASGAQVMQKIARVSAISLPEVRRRAKLIFAAVLNGADPREERRKARCVTLREFLDDPYGPWLIANRKAGAIMLERLRKGCKSLLDKKLTDINPWAIEQWRKPYVARGVRVSCNRHLSYLKSCIARAVEWRIVPSNPVAAVKRLKVDGARQNRIRTLSAEEEARLFDALDRRDSDIRSGRTSGNEWRSARGRAPMPDFTNLRFTDYLKPLIILALNSGLRRGELFGLEWPDIDLEKAILTVRAESAKSGKTRRVPLNATALDALQAWRAQSPGAGLVFTSPATGERLTSIRTAWGNLMREARVADFTPHGLRHTFASRLVLAGADLATVRELCGHSDITITAKYLHSDSGAKIAAVALLAPETDVAKSG
jgi:integrase